MLIVVGARPNFMKAAPILGAIGRHNGQASPASTTRLEAQETIQTVLVHTGQHYDDVMSGSFFRDLQLPQPDVYLGVGSGSHAVQTAEIMRKFEAVVLKEQPQVVMVVGDVNSTIACALVAAKTSFEPTGSRPLIVHVEAGLRSFDRSMPEEINRILTDQLSDVLFVTEDSGVRNLRKEGIPADRIHFVGNTMIDSLLAFQDKADTSTILEDLGLRRPSGRDGGDHSSRQYALLTLHRPANVDNRDAFLNILRGLDDLAKQCPVLFPVHPRTQRQIADFGLDSYFGTAGPQPEDGRRVFADGFRGFILTNPLGYLDFLCVMKHARLVVTDSGGIQEETTCLGVPCVTVRDNTERPVTVRDGTNVVAGTKADGIQDAIRVQLARKLEARAPEKWDGQAASRIVDVLIRAHRETPPSCGALIPQSAA
jgi:UDP-N-acetylglucosamine 2-epimerase (non-hydrolysing)